eukprot:5713771-Pleurochrysis_carterae.AAC.1
MRVSPSLQSLRSLGLANAELGDAGVARLCGALEGHSCITCLNLAQNAISSIGAEYVRAPEQSASLRSAKAQRPCAQTL